MILPTLEVKIARICYASIRRIRKPKELFCLQVQFGATDCSEIIKGFKQCQDEQFEKKNMFNIRM